MTAGEAEGLTELMRTVVTEGTGSAVRTDAYTVAAKTGSAEFETGKETHAWFTGFAPVENPKLVGYGSLWKKEAAAARRLRRLQGSCLIFIWPGNTWQITCGKRCISCKRITIFVENRGISCYISLFVLVLQDIDITGYGHYRKQCFNLT